MRWKGRAQSSNIEDRRGQSGGFMRRKSTSFGGIGFFIILLLFLFFGQGQNLLDFGGMSPQTNASSTPSPSPGQADETKEFIGVVLKTTEDVWGDIFANSNARYQKPVLTLFNGVVRSACGTTSSAVGPFYCPGDNKIYIDPGFFNELNRMGGRGDFAKAYVIAHELGHHIQSLQGITNKVTRLQQRMLSTQANKLSVRLELQADCYAGLWAHHTEKKFRLLEEGDIEEAINAAHVIGDDHMQRRAGMGIDTSAFTHGSSKQRAHWFKVGLLSGSVSKCDTFADLNI